MYVIQAVIPKLLMSVNVSLYFCFPLPGRYKGDTMVTIPKGATNIKIQELAKTINFLSKQRLKLLECNYH